MVPAVLAAALAGVHHCHLTHLTSEEREAQRGETPCPRPHSIPSQMATRVSLAAGPVLLAVMPFFRHCLALLGT